MNLRMGVGDLAAVSTGPPGTRDLRVVPSEPERRRTARTDAVTVLDKADEPTALGHALALRAYLAVQANDVTTARGLLDQARAVASRSDDWQLDVRTRLLESLFALVEGQAGGRESMLAIVGPAVDRMDEIHSSGFSNLAYLDVEQRRLPEASAVLGVSLPLTVEFDLPICHVWQLGARGRLGLLQGDWDAAERDAAAVLAAPSAPLTRTWAHLVRGLVHLRRHGDAGDDLEAAWDLA